MNRSIALGVALLLGLSGSVAHAATIDLRSAPISGQPEAKQQSNLSRSEGESRSKAASAPRSAKTSSTTSSVRQPSASVGTSQQAKSLRRSRGNLPEPTTPSETPVVSDPQVQNPPSPAETGDAWALATTYLWYFFCNNGEQCSGSGTITTDKPIGPAQVIGMSGTILGEEIRGLFAPDGWWRNDNQVISLTQEILNEGISGWTDNWYFNLYLSLNGEGGNSILICDASTNRLERRCNRTNADGYNVYYTSFARGDFLVKSPNLSPVPVPGALPLLMSALSILGFIGWRRSRMTS